VPAAGHHVQPDIWLPGRQQPLEAAGVRQPGRVPAADPQPELRDRRAHREPGDPLPRRVGPAHALVLAKRVDQPGRVAELILERSEIATQHAGRAVPEPVDESQVGGAVAALGVARDAPRPARGLHPEHAQLRLARPLAEDLRLPWERSAPPGG